ncbi:MAG: hypothetical protein ACR2NV_00985 [Thermoleophilaceae bacterium]
MGRNRSYLDRAHAPAGRWRDRYFCEWGIVVGDRVRRTRVEQGLTLEKLREVVEKPEGGGYSGGYFSRLERGWASAPLYVYIALAEALGLVPGRLLGPDDAHKPVSEAEMTLLNVLRELSISPSEAIVVLTADARPDGAPAQSM